MIQVYTGNGKGKTTAAFGLAIRSLGAGKKVYIAQFAKGRRCSELIALNRFDGIRIELFGGKAFIKKRPTKGDIASARAGLEKVKRIIAGGNCDLIILDEINIALKLGLLPVKEVLAVIKKAPGTMEIVLTGRYAPKKIIEAADLVSEIKEIKHYYHKGTKARRGIEF